VGYPCQHGEDGGEDEEEGDVAVGEEGIAEESLAEVVLLVGGVIIG